MNCGVVINNVTVLHVVRVYSCTELNVCSLARGCCMYVFLVG